MLKRLKTDSASDKPVVAVSRPFRVMVAQADGSVALFRALPNLRAASHVAKSACRRHLNRIQSNSQAVKADPKRPRCVYVERWEGSAIDGRWVRVPATRGGFCQFFDDVYQPEKQRYASGQIATCILLAEKTRRGGWRARIEGTNHVGPIVGSADSTDSQSQHTAGDKILLKVNSISRRTGAAQFTWPAS